MSIVHVHLEVEVISVMTLVEDRMARPGGGEGTNHLWNHLNSRSPLTHPVTSWMPPFQFPPDNLAPFQVFLYCSELLDE